MQARAVAAGFGRNDLAGHGVKRGALTTGVDRGEHPVRLKRLGRYKSFDVLGECLEFGASVNLRGIDSGRCCKGLGAAAARTELRLRGAKMVGFPATASSGSALEPGVKARCRCHAIHVGRRTFCSPKCVLTYGRTDAHAFGLTAVRTLRKSDVILCRHRAYNCSDAAPSTHRLQVKIKCLSRRAVVSTNVQALLLNRRMSVLTVAGWTLPGW